MIHLVDQMFSSRSIVGNSIIVKSAAKPMQGALFPVSQTPMGYRNMTDKLKDLGAYVYDSIEGYRETLEQTDDRRLKQAFSTRLTKREETLERINNALEHHGESPVDSGSTLGTFHEMWTKLTASVGDGEDAIIERVEEGEDFLKERFEEALEDENLSHKEREVIALCYEEVSRGEFFADQLESIA